MRNGFVRNTDLLYTPDYHKSQDKTKQEVCKKVNYNTS